MHHAPGPASALHDGVSVTAPGPFHDGPGCYRRPIVAGASGTGAVTRHDEPPLHGRRAGGLRAHRVRPGVPDPDLRRKLLFTLAIMALFRLGSFVPTPGVDYQAVRTCVDQVQNSDQNGLYQLVNLFSGGALLQLSVFALGIMPYITASIIIQLLTVVIPRFEALKKEGQTGTSEAHAVHALPDDRPRRPAVDDVRRHRPHARRSASFLGCQENLIPDDNIVTILIMVITMTAGTGLIMWLGELITEKRRRQRHVAADLHLDRRELPQLALGDRAAARTAPTSCCS